MAQSDYDYYTSLNSHPKTDKKEVSFKARISETAHLDGYFNSNPRYERYAMSQRGGGRLQHL